MGAEGRGRGRGRGVGTVEEVLRGGKVRRVDAPALDVVAITFAARGVEEVLVVALSGVRGVALVEERPRGMAAGAFVRQLRVHLMGARVEEVNEPVGGVVRIGVERDGTRVALMLEVDAGNAVVVDAGGAVLGALHAGELRKRGLETGASYVPPPATRPVLDDVEALRARGQTLLASRAEESFARRRDALARAIARAEKKLVRRLAAIDEDIARAGVAPRLRREGNALLASFGTIARGAKEARVMDWEATPPAEIVVKLDPARDVREQADGFFRRAKKLETGAGLATERRAATEREIGALGRLRTQLDAAAEDAALFEVADAAHRAGVAGAREAVVARRAGARKEKVERRPYRRFVASGERDVYVGRGAADNDALTQRFARPQDLWLHARGTRGAHVVVPLDRDEVCPVELLVDAATLAAHFSEARGEPIVEVSHVARRYVRKPRGAPPGLVTIEREKTMALRVEPERVARLLAAEVEA